MTNLKKKILAIAHFFGQKYYQVDRPLVSLILYYIYRVSFTLILLIPFYHLFVNIGIVAFSLAFYRACVFLVFDEIIPLIKHEYGPVLVY